VQAFFTALSPLELDAYSRVIQAERHTARDLEQAHRQQLERLRYQVALAERQFHQVDPDNRLVAAELERRWETALRELRQAEAAYAKTQPQAAPAPALPADLQAAFTTIGQQLPELWHTAVLSTTQKKALLRCLIGKVVIQRHPPAHYYFIPIRFGMRHYHPSASPAVSTASGGDSLPSWRGSGFHCPSARWAACRRRDELDRLCWRHGATDRPIPRPVSVSRLTPDGAVARSLAPGAAVR
jgi:hypothetical protein